VSLFRRNDSGIRLAVSALTDVGRSRDHNEDRYLVADLTTRDTSVQNGSRPSELGPRGSLLLVADGMGGAAAGEMASQMAVDLIFEQLVTSWSSETDDSPDLFALRVREAVERANARIHAVSQEQPHLQGMGTTATLVGILGPRLLLSQVGDSRAYLIRDGVAVQMTRDQSFVQHLLDTGRVSEAEAYEMAPRNVILQALGPSPTVEVVQHWQPLLRGDLVLLCSDGLSGLVSADDIAGIVTSTDALSKACQKLIDLANERGGPDNITVILAKMTGDGLMAPEESRVGG
jgi:serine/threonine protein phosphatase PrpC